MGETHAVIDQAPSPVRCDLARDLPRHSEIGAMDAPAIPASEPV